MSKTKFLGFMVKVLCMIAAVCASTPSRFNFYEPDMPSSLK